MISSFSTRKIRQIVGSFLIVGLLKALYEREKDSPESARVFQFPAPIFLLFSFLGMNFCNSPFLLVMLYPGDLNSAGRTRAKSGLTFQRRVVKIMPYTISFFMFLFCVEFLIRPLKCTLYAQHLFLQSLGTAHTFLNNGLSCARVAEDKNCYEYNSKL